MFKNRIYLYVAFPILAFSCKKETERIFTIDSTENVEVHILNDTLHIDTLEFNELVEYDLNGDSINDLKIEMFKYSGGSSVIPRYIYEATILSSNIKLYTKTETRYESFTHIVDTNGTFVTDTYTVYESCSPDSNTYNSYENETIKSLEANENILAIENWNGDQGSKYDIYKSERHSSDATAGGQWPWSVIYYNVARFEPSCSASPDGKYYMAFKQNKTFGYFELIVHPDFLQIHKVVVTQ